MKHDKNDWNGMASIIAARLDADRRQFGEPMAIERLAERLRDEFKLRLETELRHALKTESENADVLDRFTRRLQESSGHVELAHLAEHIGMGEVKNTKLLAAEVMQFFVALPTAERSAKLEEIEECPW